jgi:hypothetical protein
VPCGFDNRVTDVLERHRGVELAAIGALLVAGIVALVESRPPPTGERGGAEARPRTVVLSAERAPCRIGKRPRYFVPSAPGGPSALLGCARLPVSGERVEFSGDTDRFRGRTDLCINPAYDGGQFIPAACALVPPPSRFAVHDAMYPAESGRYAYVIWGTTGGARRVTARFDVGTARAAVLPVPRRLARRFGERPFGLFVVELPLPARCAPITVEGGGETDAVPPRECAGRD